MNIISIVFIAIGLSMDCLAVAVSSGAKEYKQSISFMIKAALSFGIFQALMPIIGWTIGTGFKNIISSVDHWIAFILLTTIGIKMIYESLKSEKENKSINLLSNKVLLVLSIATSIDALVVGTSLAFMNIDVKVPSLIIGIIAFTFTFFGFFAGKSLNFIFKNRIEIIGGLILIAIGLKTLIQHLS